MDMLPELVKGNLVRRGLALLVDLIVVEVLLQILAAFAYPLSGGALIDSNSVFTSCGRAHGRPAGVEFPAGFQVTAEGDCTKSLLGFPTARLYVASSKEAGSLLTTSLSYAVDRDGRLARPFDLGELQALALVAMRWLLERHGSRSLGRMWLSLRVLPRRVAPAAAEARRAIARRYVLFGLPILPGLLVALIAHLYGIVGGPEDAGMLSVLTFLGNLPLTVAALASIGSVARGLDAYYDGASGTTVARLVDGAVEVAPERPERVAAVGGRHAAARAVPWASMALAAVMTAAFVAEELYPFKASHPLGVTVPTMVLFGGASGELVLQIGQWYRLLTAVFLHASLAHLLANAVVLVAAGWFLEGLLGRGWFVAAFLLGGLAGSLASVNFDPPSLVSLGASGAVTAVIAAGLTASFAVAADPARRWLMAFCAACLLAALQATGRFAWGTVDRADHVGGALGGVVVGLVVLAAWRRGRARPPLQAAALGTALAVSAALFVSVPLAGFGDAPLAALLVPPDKAPKTDAEWAARSADLVRRYPSDPRAHFGRALAAGSDQAEREREVGLAIAAHLRLMPGDGPSFEQNVYMALGAERQAGRDWSAAQDLFSRAIAAAPPGSPDAFARRAEVEVRQGLFEQAVQDLRALSARDPKSSLLHVEVADALFAKGDAASAVEELDAALALSPDDPTALRNRGWIGFFAGRRHGAVPALERGAALGPKDAYAALWLDIVAVRTGLPDRMGELVKEIDTGVWPGPVVRFFLNEIGANELMADASDPDAVKQAEQRCEADFYYGEWQLMQHAPEEAQHDLQEAAATCPKNFNEFAAVRAELSGAAARGVE